MSVSPTRKDINTQLKRIKHMYPTYVENIDINTLTLKEKQELNRNILEKHNKKDLLEWFSTANRIFPSFPVVVDICSANIVK